MRTSGPQITGGGPEDVFCPANVPRSPALAGHVLSASVLGGRTILPAVGRETRTANVRMNLLATDIFA